MEGSFTNGEHNCHIDKTDSTDTVSMFLRVKDITKAESLLERIELSVTVNQHGEYSWVLATYKDMLTITATENKEIYKLLID